MSHDFLTSMHSQVIVVPDEQRGAKPPLRRPRRGRPALTMAGLDEKHRTIGVSMPPRLRQQAGERAAEVGLSFSRYVQWCIEAELDGSSIAARFSKGSVAGPGKLG